MKSQESDAAQGILKLPMCISREKKKKIYTKVINAKLKTILLEIFHVLLL